MQVTISTNPDTGQRTVVIGDMEEDQWRRLCRIFGHSSRGEVYDGVETRKFAAEVDLVLNPGAPTAIVGEPAVHEAPQAAYTESTTKYFTLSSQAASWLTKSGLLQADTTPIPDDPNE